MNAILKTDDLIVHDGEPTIADLRLAELLGYERLRNIRKLISRYEGELGRYGRICSTVEQNTGERGRPSKQYHLNELQALCIVAVSDAPRAADAREQMIRVFAAYRKGQLQPTAMSAVPAEVGTLLAAKVGMLNWITKVRGAEAAISYLPDLGLAPLRPTYDPEAVACLVHLLDTWTGPADRTVREALNAAFKAKEGPRNRLRGYGLDLAGDGFIVANVHRYIAQTYDGTRWERPFEYLRRLPGTSASRAGWRTRPNEATYIPSHYLDFH